MSNGQATSIESLRAPVPQQGGPVALGETAASAQAAQAKAIVLARYEMALRRPRDWDAVRQELLKECRRPSFANNKSALYRKPVGQGIEGLGIRFVEVALRCMKNVSIDSSLTYEDDLKESISVSVTDLEENTTYSADVKVSKTVERSKPMDDGSYLSMRKNSYDKPVYTIPATDDDLLNKRNALVSKAVRTLGLRLIPGDLQDEAEEIIRRVRKDDAAKDPDSARKAMVDAFGEIGVRVEMLVDYLGHSLEEITPDEIVELRGFYGAIKDGEATWRSVMEHRRENPNYKSTAKKAEDLKKPTAQSEKQADAQSGAGGRMAEKQKEPAKAEEPTQQQRDALAKASPKARPVVTERGRVLMEIGYAVKLGDILQDPDGLDWRVMEWTDKQVLVRAHQAAESQQKAVQEEKPAPGEATQVDLQTVLNEIMAAETSADLKGAEELIARLPEKDQATCKALLETKKNHIAKPRRRGGNLE